MEHWQGRRGRCPRGNHIVNCGLIVRNLDQFVLQKINEEASKRGNLFENRQYQIRMFKTMPEKNARKNSNKKLKKLHDGVKGGGI